MLLLLLPILLCQLLWVASLALVLRGIDWGINDDNKDTPAPPIMGVTEAEAEQEQEQELPSGTAAFDRLPEELRVAIFTMARTSCYPPTPSRRGGSVPRPIPATIAVLRSVCESWRRTVDANMVTRLEVPPREGNGHLNLIRLMPMRRRINDAPSPDRLPLGSSAAKKHEDAWRKLAGRAAERWPRVRSITVEESDDDLTTSTPSGGKMLRYGPVADDDTLILLRLNLFKELGTLTLLLKRRMRRCLRLPKLDSSSSPSLAELRVCEFVQLPPLGLWVGLWPPSVVGLGQLIHNTFVREDHSRKMADPVSAFVLRLRKHRPNLCDRVRTLRLGFPTGIATAHIGGAVVDSNVPLLSKLAEASASPPFPNLTELDLSDTKVLWTVAEFALRLFPKLRSLDLSRTEVTSRIKEPLLGAYTNGNLRRVRLPSSHFGDAVVRHGVAEAEHLDLDGQHVTDDADDGGVGALGILRQTFGEANVTLDLPW